MTFSLGQFSSHPIMAMALLVLVLLSLVATAYLALQRLKKHPARLTLVWVSSTIASLCIIALAIDIHVRADEQATSVLITEGVTLEQLDTLNEKQPIFVLGTVSKDLKQHDVIQKAVIIQDPIQVFSADSSLQSLKLVGSGLSKQQWQNLNTGVPKEQLEQIHIQFSPNKLAIGLVDIQFKKHLAVGQYLAVTGHLQNESSAANDDTIYELSLVNPIGETIETQRLKVGEAFKFSTSAKSHGQWLYRLQLSNQSNPKQPLIDEPVAVSVKANSPMEIFIKQSAPSFETRHFSNWASQFGTKLLIATKISKSKDITQTVNFNDDEIAALNKPLSLEALQTFDLLILDGRAALTLLPNEIQALSNSIQQGLGVLVLVDSDLASAWPLKHIEWLDNLSVTPLDIATYSSVPSWPNSSIEEAIDINKAELSSTSDQVLVTGNNNANLVVIQNMGLGNVALSLINSSYSWQTSAKNSEYSHYWQTLLQHIVKPSQTIQWLPEDKNTLQFDGDPFNRCLLGNVTTASIAYLSSEQNSEDLPVTGLMLQPNKHCVALWPVSAGWYKLNGTEQANTTTQNVEYYGYTYALENWRVWRQSQAIAATKQALLNRQQVAETPYYQSLNKFWFWVALVLALSLLWVERKLF